MNRLWVKMLLFSVSMLYIEGFVHSLSLHCRRSHGPSVVAGSTTRHHYHLLAVYNRWRSRRLYVSERSDWSSGSYVNNDPESDGERSIEEIEADVIDVEAADGERSNEDIEADIIDAVDGADLIDSMKNSTDVDDVNSTYEEEEVDPLAKAVADYENSLRNQVISLETLLRTEKNNLLRWKDRISETGKNGYFIVQAQVNDFSRKRDSDQKQRVKNNKREFIEKMLPLVDAFRSAPLLAPAVTEKELSMHKTYGALLDNILAVFQKFGYKEFDIDAGEKLNPTKHQISQMEETDDVEEGTILRSVRKGLSDGEGDVLRRALVIVSKRIVALADAAPANSIDSE